MFLHTRDSRGKDQEKSAVVDSPAVVIAFWSCVGIDASSDSENIKS